MNRILTFHYEGVKASGDRIGSAYYLEGDYIPVAVRIHAETAPDIEDAEFEILKDGVSIMNNRNSIRYNSTTGLVTANTTSTTAVLAKGESTEIDADDFKDGEIGDCWMTCKLSKDGGGRNFTIQLELEEISDED